MSRVQSERRGRRALNVEEADGREMLKVRKIVEVWISAWSG